MSVVVPSCGSDCFAKTFHAIARKLTVRRRKPEVLAVFVSKGQVFVEAIADSSSRLGHTATSEVIDYPITRLLVFFYESPAPLYSKRAACHAS